MMLFVEKLQLAQMMFIAESVKTIVVSEVRLEVVVDNPILAARQNVEIVHGFNTSFGMNAIKGPLGVADNVQPVEFLGDPDSAFVAMIERSLGEQIHQSQFKGGQTVIGALVGGGDGGFAQRLAIKVLTNLG